MLDGYFLFFHERQYSESIKIFQKKHTQVSQRKKKAWLDPSASYCAGIVMLGEVLGTELRILCTFLLLSCTPNLKMVVFVCLWYCCLSEVGSYRELAGWPWIPNPPALATLLESAGITSVYHHVMFLFVEDFFCTEHWMLGFIHVECFPPELSPQPSLT